MIFNRTTLLLYIIISLLLCIFVIGQSTKARNVDRCTAFIAGNRATSNGSTLNTHTDDCYDCDFRIVQIPSRSYNITTPTTTTTTTTTLASPTPNNKQGDDTNATTTTAPYTSPDQRPIPPMRFLYPRYIGTDRGSVFYDSNVDKALYNWSQTSPFGSIPQVNTTFSYIEGSYAISNEHGVSFGESTCGGRFVAAPLYDGGKALFEISELGKVALERARTAREAIKIVGELAQQYGFFSAEWGADDLQIEGGEAYTVADPFEAWVMHILPDHTGTSAVWVAQRVPDNHVAVVTNTFIIRDIPYPHQLDENIFMMSSNIYTVAYTCGLWDPMTPVSSEYIMNPDINNLIYKDTTIDWDSPLQSQTYIQRLDFKRVYGWPMPIYREPYVSRRQWRILSLSAPSLHLASTLTSFELPFSVKPDTLLTIQDVIKYHRDHFEGTPYDTTTGLESGPYGNPNRYDQYQGTNDAHIISETLKSLFQDVDTTLSLNPHLEQSGQHTIPADLYKKLTNDDIVFSEFPFATKYNFTSYHYDNNTIEQAHHIINSIAPDTIHLADIRGDVYGIDRTQGHPLADDEINKGFVERTISLFRTAYTAISEMIPSYQSLYYPNSKYIMNDPLFTLPWEHDIVENTNTSDTKAKSSKVDDKKKLQRDIDSKLSDDDNNNSTSQLSYQIRNSQKSPLPIRWERSFLPRHVAFTTYLSLHAPSSSSFTPIFPSLPPQLPSAYTTGHLLQYSPDSAWWHFASVSNYANNAYRYMIRDINYAQQIIETPMHESIVQLRSSADICIRSIVQEQQHQGDNNLYLSQSTLDNILLPLEKMILSLLHPDVYNNDGYIYETAHDRRSSCTIESIIQYIQNNTNESSLSISITSCYIESILNTYQTSYILSSRLLETWKELFHHLLGRYRDGYRIDTPRNGEYNAVPLFYPTWWLQATRFWRPSLGDPAAGRGYEYYSGKGNGLFSIDQYDTHSQRYYEIDHLMSPGEHCIAPRFWNGTGLSLLSIGQSYCSRMQQQQLRQQQQQQQQPQTTPYYLNTTSVHWSNINELPLPQPATTTASITNTTTTAPLLRPWNTEVGDLFAMWLLGSVVAAGLVLLGYIIGRHSTRSALGVYGPGAMYQNDWISRERMNQQYQQQQRQQQQMYSNTTPAHPTSRHSSHSSLPTESTPMLQQYDTFNQ